MKKIVRLCKEGFFAVRSVKNFWNYFFDRLGLFSDRRVVIKFWNGISYHIETNTNHAVILNEVWHLGVYDRFLRSLRREEAIIDIGANIGVFSVKAAQWAKSSKVFSFEPFTENFEILKANIALNNLGGRVFPIQKAIGSSRGTLTLFSQPHDSGGVSAYAHGDSSTTRSVSVPMVTLEDVFRENDIETCGLIKIDCEGAEKDILLATPRSLFHRIARFSIEWHEVFHHMSVREGEEFFKELGYQVYYDPDAYTIHAWRS